MHVEDKTKAFRQVLKKDQLARLQEMRSLPEQVYPSNPYGQRTRLHKMRKNLELKSKSTFCVTEHKWTFYLFDERWKAIENYCCTLWGRRIASYCGTKPRTWRTSRWGRYEAHHLSLTHIIWNSLFLLGNNKVKLNKNEYIHWQPADWINSHGMDRYFSMDHKGELTVKDHGVFLIYAQVETF